MKEITLLFVCLCCALILHAQVSKTVEVTAGNLSSVLTDEELNNVTNLTLTGTIDTRDFVTMRDSMPILADLDMSGVAIEAHYGDDGTSLWGNYDYPANAIPEFSFSYSDNTGKTSLTSVILPPSVTKIGLYAFFKCSGINAIIIPEGVLKIGEYAFHSCNGLSSITIPSTVSSIGEASFLYFPGLILVDEDNLHYSGSEGVLFNKSKSTLLQCPTSKTGSYTIPALVDSIGTYAFQGCTGLTSIILPEALSSIGYQSFWDCSNLKSVTIPLSVTSIQSFAFANCFSLDTIYVNSGFPVDLNNSYGAFEGVDTANCILSVPYRTAVRYDAADKWTDFANIVEDANGFFLNSNSLSFTSAGGIDTISISANVEWTATSSQEWLTVIPETVTGNDTLTFTAEANTLSVTRKATVIISSTGIPSQTISITQEAGPKTLELTAGSLAALLTAEEKNNITALTLTGTIDARDFVTMRDSIPLLTEIDMNGVTIVEYNGIEGTNPSRINYPANAIPSDAFYNSITWSGKYSLKSVSLPSTVIEIGDSAFYNCSALNSLTLPSTVKVIGRGAFQGCSGIELFSIPEGVAIIGDYSFSSCYGLNSITIPSTVGSIGEGAFLFCSGLTSITITEGVDSIGRYAFNYCSKLTSVTIPSTVTSIGQGAFLYFTGSISVDESNPNYSGSEGVLFNKGQTILIQCPVSKSGSYSLPILVDSIGINAFLDCTGLNSITLPEGLLSIGKNAFYGCFGLLSIVLPDGLLSVDSSAFASCSGLSKINFPSSVTSLQSFAFGYCYGLDSIYASSEIPVDLSGSSDVFYDVNKTTCNLYVPYGTAGRYAAANQWQDFENIVEDANGFLLYSDSLSFTDAGGSDTISIFANVEWSAISDQPWLSVIPGTGTGNDILTFTAEPNTGSALRMANVTVRSSGYSDKIITVSQSPSDWPSDINVNYTVVLPVIDGVEDAIWDAVAPVQVTKNFREETPTVTAFWKALWTNDGLYVMLNVQDDNHWPGWELGRNFWEFDCGEIYFDVNDTLADGLGPKTPGSGHYQAYTCFVPELYGVTIENEPPTTQYTGGTFAYTLSGENYTIERFIPFENFIDKNERTLNRSTFLEKGKIGFDINIADQDEGVTTTRLRKVWQNDGENDESWNNMDDCGTVTLTGINLLQSDSLALVALYNATNGDDWTNNDNWLTGTLDTWYGVTIDLGRVTQLVLDWNNLTGQIPTEIGNLTKLNTLNINGSNFIPAPIPDFSSLVSINFLDAQNCNFTGEFPPSILKLRTLYSLNLSYNQFTGNIPSEIGSLDLGYLFLNNNQFSGAIPVSIGNQSYLNKLYLNNNELTGSIPEEFSNLVNLAYCHLNNNQLSGDLTSSFGSLLVNLYSFQVQNNKFTFANLAASGVFPGDIYEFSYAPQDTLFTITKDANTLVAMDCHADGNNFTWFKDDVQLSDATRTINIQGSGNYWFTVDNPSYPGLLIYSDTLSVEAIPTDLTVVSQTIGDGVDECFGATQTITVAGTGASVVLQSGSSTNFIAGQSVRFLPGFYAHSGSFAHAYITIEGSFCDIIEPGIVASPAAEKSAPEGDLPKQSFVEGERLLRVYPNPNNGCFKIELTNFENKASVCVYNSMGIRVYQSEAGGIPIREINLPAISKGIYFVRVADGKEQFTKKMVVK